MLSVYYTYNQRGGKERELRKSPPIIPSGELWQSNEGKTSLYSELSECFGHAFETCAGEPWGLRSALAATFASGMTRIT